MIKRDENMNRGVSVILLCLTLVIITVAVYQQVGNHPFINLDDGIYTIGNPHITGGFTRKNIMWAFTSVEQNWQPVAWLSHMMDAQLYNMNPRGHHMTSVIFHTLSALLLLLLLRRLTDCIWQSFFVAALFAIHPLNVESVAWVAERRDVLSAMFWFLTLLVYAEYVKRRKILLYISSLFIFMLGLMSKPMLVTLPIIMLFIDKWPLDRYQHEQDSGKSNARIIFLINSTFAVVNFRSC